MSRRLHRRQNGFTLIELTVSLVAGLIVALGIMALSREATRTFNEEVRGAAAEATMRTAIDRLRADLQRAGYMSTANIMGDPMIAKVPGATNIANTKPSMGGILHLQSINLSSGGSLATNGLPLSGVQTPALAPDSFDLGGNMTTAEQFEVQMIVPGGSGCTQVLLSSASAAMYRIAATGLGSAAATQELRNAFQPVPAGMTTQFIVRLVDTTGHTQYLATCDGCGGQPGAAGFTGTQPYACIDTADTPIQYASQTTGASVGSQAIGGATGYCVGCILNPVQLVRWEITSATKEATNTPQYAVALDNTPTSYVAGVGGAIDVNKYDLMRTYLDATDTPVLATSEVVAEYAVDLKLAFSVDTTTLSDQFPSVTTLAFSDTTNGTKWGQDVTKSNPFVANVGPQRIRSARVRLVTRAAQPDRTVSVAVPSPAGLATDFMYRYCVNSSPSCATSDGTLRWARARTVTAEVSLPNTSQDFF
jgi:prepilin-type N-terminal cleavage/methylation domain-containing protein